VLLIEHAQIKSFQDPELPTAYDRYQLKINDKAEALVREAADAVVFARFETELVKTNGKTRAYGISHPHRRKILDYIAQTKLLLSSGALLGPSGIRKKLSSPPRNSSEAMISACTLEKMITRSGDNSRNSSRLDHLLRHRQLMGLSFYLPFLWMLYRWLPCDQKGM